MDINKEALDRDFAIRLANTLFNPFESENIIKPVGAGPLGSAVAHGAGLAAGYGGLAFLLRRLQVANERTKGPQEEERLQSYVRAAHPTLDLPELKPLEEKSAGLIGPGTHPAHLAIAVGLTLMGAAGGYRLADYISDKENLAQVGSDIETKRKKLETLTQEEFERLGKTAAKKGLPITELGVSGGDPDTPFTLGSAVKGGLSLYILYAAAAAAMAYKTVKSSADLKDENRIKMKAFRDASKAMAKSHKAPYLHTNLPESNELAKQDKSKKQLGPVPLPTNVVSPAQKSVDKSDPYANLL